MKLLIITNLFPNFKEPTRGMYNYQMIAELSKFCQLEVVAPIPWYPLRCFTPDGKNTRDVQTQELIEGIKVYHPRYFMVPVIGRFLSGLFFYFSLLPVVKKICNNFKFDIFLALWAYPDGFGSILLGKRFNKPVAIEALGSDINLYCDSVLRKRLISWALKKAEKIFVVSAALGDKIVGLGVTVNTLKIVLNGVDRNLFKPLNKIQCRTELKLPLDKKIILFIGNLVPVKGVEHLIDAFQKINDNINYLLVLVGDGILKTKLKSRVLNYGIHEHVYFAGRQTYSQIPLWLNACDVFCLPSLYEGCPNVILEALACGKPIVATNVGGIPEVINKETGGILVPPRDPVSLASGLKKLLDAKNGSGDQNKAMYQRTWSNVAEDIFHELQAVLK